MKKNLVGENLRKIRKRMRLTQEEVALRSGLSQGYINQLESGKRMFTQKSLEQIAEGLNIKIIDFFKTEEDTEAVQERIVEYRVRRGRPSYKSYKKEVLSLLDELPPRIREHYITLLRLESELWKR